MKGKTKGLLIEGAFAGVLGYTYYWYLFIHQTIEIIDPDFLFFAVLIALLIASLFMSKAYFYLIFSLTAVAFWIFLNTDIFNKLTQNGAMMY